MTDEDLKVVLDELQKYEGRTSWLYLDNAATPNVTIGVGCLIANVDAALKLPFHHVTDGLPAVPDEISHDFFRVRAMMGGLLAVRYKGDLRLAEDAIDQLGFVRLRWFLAKLPAVFPGYDDFPLSVKQVLLDLAWNVGLGAPASASHEATGLHAWRGLRASCAAGDWLEGAHHCTTANPNNIPAREARNQWRISGFRQAAHT